MNLQKLLKIIKDHQKKGSLQCFSEFLAWSRAPLRRAGRLPFADAHSPLVLPSGVGAASQTAPPKASPIFIVNFRSLRYSSTALSKRAMALWRASFGACRFIL